MNRNPRHESKQTFTLLAKKPNEGFRSIASSLAPPLLRQICYSDIWQEREITIICTVVHEVAQEKSDGTITAIFHQVEERG